MSLLVCGYHWATQLASDNRRLMAVDNGQTTVPHKILRFAKFPICNQAFRLFQAAPVRGSWPSMQIIGKQ